MSSFDLRLDAEGHVKDRLPAVEGDLAIYLFRSGPEVIRVGETSTGTRRIRAGFNRKLMIHDRQGRARRNFYAYPWRASYANRVVHVDYFALDPTTFGENTLRRALEAEVTYALRQHHGRWPCCMSEIHFLERHRQHPALIRELERIVGGCLAPSTGADTPAAGECR